MAQAPEAKLGPDGLPREAAPTASEPNMLERMSDSANASIQAPSPPVTIPRLADQTRASEPACWVLLYRTSDLSF